MKQLVQGAIDHVLCDNAEELWLIADTKYLDYVVETGLMEHLCFLQQAIPLPGTVKTNTTLIEHFLINNNH